MAIIRQNLNGPSIIFIDQAAVSATNFFTSIILARFLGIHEFGTYSLFFLFLILLNTFHHSIFSAPMMSLAPSKRDQTSREQYFLSIKAAQSITSLVIALLCYGLILPIAHQINNTDLLHNLIPFTLCVFIIPMQEWMRRSLFTKQLKLKALFLDIIKSMIQVGLLFYYALTGSLSVATALYIMAFSSATIYLIGSARQILPSNFAGIRSALTENWEHARHLLPSYLLEWTRLQGFMILGGLFLGVQAIGAIRAAQNIIGPLNVIYQAADNIFPIEGARRLAHEGRRSMTKYFKEIALKGILLLSIPCLLIAFSSQWVMDFLYGSQFSEYHTLIIWQAISLLLVFILKVGTSFMRTIHATKPVLTTSLVGAIALITLIAPFSILLNEDGVMLAKVTAEIFSLYVIVINVKALVINKHSKQSNIN